MTATGIYIPGGGGIGKTHPLAVNPIFVAELASSETDRRLIPELHPHAGGFMDFEPEIERLLQEVDADTLITKNDRLPSGRPAL